MGTACRAGSRVWDACAATFVRRVSLGAPARVRRNQAQDDLILLLGRMSANLQRLARRAEEAGDRDTALALEQVRNETLAAVRRIG